MRLEASRLGNACRFTCHVLETSTKILHCLRPCRTVDTKSIEYRRGLNWCRTVFARYSITSQPIKNRKVVRFSDGQKALVAATLLASTRSRPYRIVPLIDRNEQTIRDTAFVWGVRTRPFGWRGIWHVMHRGRRHLLSTGQRTNSIFPLRKLADLRSIDLSATRTYLVFIAVYSPDSAIHGCNRTCDAS